MDASLGFLGSRSRGDDMESQTWHGAVVNGAMPKPDNMQFSDDWVSLVVLFVCLQLE